MNPPPSSFLRRVGCHRCVCAVGVRVCVQSACVCVCSRRACVCAVGVRVCVQSACVCVYSRRACVCTVGVCVCVQSACVRVCSRRARVCAVGVWVASSIHNPTGFLTGGLYARSRGPVITWRCAGLLHVTTRPCVSSSLIYLKTSIDRVYLHATRPLRHLPKHVTLRPLPPRPPLPKHRDFNHPRNQRRS